MFRARPFVHKAPAKLAAVALGVVLALAVLSLAALLAQPSFHEWFLIEGISAFRCAW